MARVTRRALDDVVGDLGEGWCIDFHWTSPFVLEQDEHGKMVFDPVVCIGVTLRSFPVTPGADEPADAVHSQGGAQAVSTALIRRINWSGLIESQRRQMAAEVVQTMQQLASTSLPADVVTPLYRGLEVQAQSLHPGPRKGKRGPRPRYDRAHFEKVADIYRFALGIGNSPTKMVATAFQIPASTANKWVARARAAGVLERPKGRFRKETRGGPA